MVATLPTAKQRFGLKFPHAPTSAFQVNLSQKKNLLRAGGESTEQTLMKSFYCNLLFAIPWTQIPLSIGDVDYTSP